MTEPWDADVEISAELARSLIEEQFPEFTRAELRELGAGWDNVVYLVDDAWVFRLPRRKLGAEILAHECRWLPRLGPALTVRASVPERIGRPTAHYPYAFAGYRLVEGTTACALELDAAARSRLAPGLARFLRALHTIEPDAEALRDGPRDEIGRTDLALRLAMSMERLLRLSRRLGTERAGRIRGEATALAGTPASDGAPTWVHGDLYARHLVLDGGGELTGVIDWGDVHLGDPALDLSIAYSFLDAPAREPFFREYGEVDGATRDRARFRALFYGLVLLDDGVAKDDPDLVRVGETALELAS